MPRSSKNYGYNTGAWGKWHNTPEEQITSKGPFEYWPTGYGFEYFYGFLAGEASQYEPTLTRNTTQVTAHLPKGYHLTDDIADDAIKWLREQKAYAPDKPFFMYWAPGASHGPHQIMKEWADKYKGKFDDGWDKYRERVFARAKAKGWIPQNAQLTPRPASMASWDSIPEAEKPFQRRLMEVFAGFTEHADYNAGRVIDEIAKQGKLDNTLIFYIWGDNGSSSEGLNGTISEQLAQNGIPTKISQHLEALKELGGLDALGGPKTDNMYHAAWAWAGSTPYQGTKLHGRLLRWHPPADGRRLAEAHQGRPDGPAAVPPRDRHRADDLRADEDHPAPRGERLRAGSDRRRQHGLHVRRRQGAGDAEDPVLRHHGQPRDLQRRLVRERAGPREPWVGGVPKGIKEWSPLTDKWELYNLDEDWSQANDLAASNPRKARGDEGPLPARIDEEQEPSDRRRPVVHGDVPSGGRPRLVLTEWTFDGPMTRMPESAAPKLGKVDSLVTMDVDVPANANGVLYALAGFSGGVTCYVKDGVLNYEFNLFEVQRTKIQSKAKLPTGKVKIEVESRLVAKIGGPMDVTLKVNGAVVGQGRVPAAMSLHFTANETFDIGSDLDSPVSLDYFDQAPFAFNGTIGTTKITYLKK